MNRIISAILFSIIFSGCASLIPPTLAPTAIAPLKVERVSGTKTPESNSIAAIEEIVTVESTQINPSSTESGEVSLTGENHDSTPNPSETNAPEITETLSSIISSTLTVNAEQTSSLSATATFTETQLTLTTILTSIPETATIIAPTPTDISTIIPASPTNTSIPQPPATPIPPGCNPNQNGSFESQVISLINQERANAGLPALSNQSQLASAARSHSNDMACNEFFSHTSPTSGSPFDRIAAVGYSYSWAGENIAAGYSSPASVVASWMASSGHRTNILNPNFTQTGVGYIYLSGSPYGVYWTQTFGKP